MTLENVATREIIERLARLEQKVGDDGGHAERLDRHEKQVMDITSSLGEHSAAIAVLQRDHGSIAEAVRLDSKTIATHDEALYGTKGENGVKRDAAALRRRVEMLEADKASADRRTWALTAGLVLAVVAGVASRVGLW